MSGCEQILDAALGYAAAGWHPFPCRPQTKEPATAHGFKDGTASTVRIRAWWTACPDYNVAIPTGYPGPDVLDVDVRDEGNGWQALNEVKRAGLLTGARALVRTPGGGLHVYFAGSDQPCGRLPGRFLDFKARGGYVLAPPSVVDGKSYALLDHRAGTAGLDWRAVRRLLEPAPARERHVPGPAAGEMTEAQRAAFSATPPTPTPKAAGPPRCSTPDACTPSTVPALQTPWPTSSRPPCRGTTTRRHARRCTSATAGSAAAARLRRRTGDRPRDPGSPGRP